MKTYKNLYIQVYNLSNLLLAWRKAREGKTKKNYVIEFEKNLIENLLDLHFELKTQKYSPHPLKAFILRDPKTRKISKSHFRDRIIHHALVRIIETVFEKSFIYDSCANRRKKGNLFAIKRLQKFLIKVSRNGKIKGWFNKNQIRGYCLKCDIRHYFNEVDHEILLDIIFKKIKDEKVIWLIRQILDNGIISKRSEYNNCKKIGMPLGNLTSQFFANIYLNELDRFVKHKLRAKYYIRYVDDFILLHDSKYQLEKWKKDIEEFLKNSLELELHRDKSKIIPISRGVDFLGFRNFYHFRLLRKRNLRKIRKKIREFEEGKISCEKFKEIFQGWEAYAKHASSKNILDNLIKEQKLVL